MFLCFCRASCRESAFAPFAAPRVAHLLRKDISRSANVQIDPQCTLFSVVSVRVQIGPRCTSSRGAHVSTPNLSEAPFRIECQSDTMSQDWYLERHFEYCCTPCRSARSECGVMGTNTRLAVRTSALRRRRGAAVCLFGFRVECVP